MIEKLVCSQNETTIKTIYEKVNELIRESGEFEDCCNHMRSGDDIKTLRVGEFLYLTNDGTDPIAVPLPNPLPAIIETHMNHHKMAVIVHNHVPILAMFMNGVIVFYGEFELILPQYHDTFSLEAFIEGEFSRIGIDGTGMYLKIINNHVQPTMKTGNLSKYKRVELFNNGEFTGTRPGDDGVIFQNNLILHNLGVIKGAGGSGYPGTNGKDGSDSEFIQNRFFDIATSLTGVFPAAGYGGTQRGAYGQWRHVYYSGYDPENGQPSQVFTVSLNEQALLPNHNIDFKLAWTRPVPPYNVKRYIASSTTGPGLSQGGYAMSANAHTLWGTATINRHPTLRVGTRSLYAQAYSYTLNYQTKETYKGGNGGIGGTAGIGQSFSTIRTDGTAGTPGTPSTPAGGNDGTSGTAGSNGGDWGVAGGPPGQPAGKAVTGKNYWLNLVADGPGSVIGDLV